MKDHQAGAQALQFAIHQGFHGALLYNDQPISQALRSRFDVIKKAVLALAAEFDL